MTGGMAGQGRSARIGDLMRVGAVIALALASNRCASAPPQPAAPPPPTFHEKMSWIIRLEDQRILRDPVVEEAPIVAPPSRGGRPAVPVAAPRPRPDLAGLLQDSEARIRRRAALAIGRVGLPEGVAPLAALLAGDPDEEVRRMAAFAMGLVGDGAPAEPLTAALADADPIVRGRAAEALAAIGATTAASAIGEMVRGYVTAAFAVENEDLSYPLTPEVEAFRLGLYALARLKAFEPIASAVLEEKGQPILWWWPVAYALQRVEDPRALPALITLAGVEGTTGVAFAVQGLGALGDPRAIEALAALLDLSRRAPAVVASAVRALGRIDDPRAGDALFRFVKTKDLSRALRLEAVEALGAHPVEGLTDVLLELVTHSWSPLRAASLRALARTDAQTFMLVLSTLDPDPDWRVRAALADALAFVDREVAVYRLAAMLEDSDHRVLPRVLTALTGHLGAEAAPHLFRHLAHDDVVVRKTAASLLGQVKAEGALEALAHAYAAGLSDSTYLVRAAALEALASIDGAVARNTLEQALTDPDWAVRVRAASLLEGLDAEADYQTAIRPAPSRSSVVAYASAELIDPSVSPHVYLDTEKGTIEIELAVLDAPLTALNFASLARAGFFQGLTFHRVVPNFVVQGGDPRSDGEGGPGYTIRDEINDRPYLRGTVGMALDWEDTGGSQFFITHAPQPHLDGRYTVFGHVVAGLEVVDQLEQGDIIRGALIWDGVNPMQTNPVEAR